MRLLNIDLVFYAANNGMLQWINLNPLVWIHIIIEGAGISGSVETNSIDV